jgi:general transcription factor 3C polypeptide 3 (transcription factor C subunit 4)
MRILQISLGTGLRATEAFVDSRLQKHLFREMRAHDGYVKDGRELKWYEVLGRYTLKGEKGDDEDEGEGGMKTRGQGKKGKQKEQEKDQGEKKNKKMMAPEKPRLPTKLNPLHLIMYGMLCLSAKSYQSAICAFPLRIIPALLTNPFDRLPSARLRLSQR